MAEVFGEYQGINILDGEWSHRAGTDPGRGWVRVLLSDLGGTIPQVMALTSVIDIFNRRRRDFTRVLKSFLPAQQTSIGSTTLGPSPPRIEKGSFRLNGPFGQLVMETNADGPNVPATKLDLPNIFWVEAVLEDFDQETQQEGVVRIELADERVLWALGGAVNGWWNRVINDSLESVAGKILQWDPSVANPTKVRDISKSLAQADKSRPILDERTIRGGGKRGQASRPHLLAEMLGHILENLPGPPTVNIRSTRASKKVPLNIDWTGATLAKNALEDFLNRYNLVIVPDYQGFYEIYDREQDPASGAAQGQAANVFVSPADVDEVFVMEGSTSESVVTVPLKPLAVEVVGERTIQAVKCAKWRMVIKDDGETLKSGGSLGRAGQWVDMKEWLDSTGYSFEEAVRSLMANYDRNSSNIFNDMPPQDPKDPKFKLRKRLLQQHFFKSFMVDGESRRFLPMILTRAEGGSHALNLNNMAIQREAHFDTDSWSPARKKGVSLTSLLGNDPLIPFAAGELARVDKTAGVITFKEPMGTIIYKPNFGFLDDSAKAEVEARSDLDRWTKAVDKLERDIQRLLDGAIYRLTNPSQYEDYMTEIRKVMRNFAQFEAFLRIPQNAKFSLDPKTLSVLSAGGSPGQQEKAAQTEHRDLTAEAISVAECYLLPPRILGHWGWEMNTGRSDDWYRFRGGIEPHLAAYPLKVRGLRQYIAQDGKTNKEALDILSQIQIDEFLEQREKAISGQKSEFFGFHQIALAGTQPEVTFRISAQDPPEAQTTALRNRYQHGIDGRAGAVATWTAFKKPIPSEGGVR